MRIITTKGEANSEKEAVIFIFNDDNELNEFVKNLVTTPVKTSGVRIFPLIPPGITLNPMQDTILGIINGMDGLGSNNIEKDRKIIDNTIDGIKGLIK